MFYRARYYNPALGRFPSQDRYPVNFGNPVELNRYVYTANNPINRADPGGHWGVVDYGAVLNNAFTAAEAAAEVGFRVGMAILDSKDALLAEATKDEDFDDWDSEPVTVYHLEAV
jgi:hypothetical protein